MTVSSRSDGRRGLRLAALLVSMALVSSAMAQDGNEVVRLAEEARHAFVAAEQANVNQKQKAGLYQVVRARIKLLEKFASQGQAGAGGFRDGARAELTRLADEGLDHDMVSAMLLQASLAELAAAQAGADRTDVGVALHQIASEQRSSSYRAAAFVEVARAYARAGLTDRAWRYASLALDAAGSISDSGTRTGVLSHVARVASGLGAHGSVLADRAIGSIATGQERAKARQALAREQLKGTPFERGADPALAIEAKRRMAMGDFPGAVALVLALQDGAEREELLAASLDGSMAKQDSASAVRAAQGLFDQARQGAALSRVVAFHVQQGMPLRAADLVNGFEDGPGKASIQAALAAELRKAGYDRMAELLAPAGVGDARAVEPVQERGDPSPAVAQIKSLIEHSRAAPGSDAQLKARIGELTTDEDKADVAVALAGRPDAGAEAAELARSIRSDLLRVKSFRRLAEIRSHQLMDSAETGPAGSGDSGGAELAASEEAAHELQTRRGLALVRMDASPPASVRAKMPSRLVTAADIRAGVPWPAGAVVASTFANHNPYIAKFLGDAEGGDTRLERAIRHQGLSSPRIIVLQSGTATLGMVARQLQATEAHDLIALEGDAVVVRAPIVVAPGARLILSRLDAAVYKLSADAGAFIANAGEIDVVDATVVGVDEAAGQPAWSDGEKADSFRPYLVTWGDGRLNVASSVLTTLGYDGLRASGLTYSSGPDRVAELRDQAPPTGVVVDSVFRNLYVGVTFHGADRVQVVGNEYRDSVLHAVDAHDGSKGSIIALNAIHGTMLRHGITVSREVDDHLVTGNLSFDNAGSGIVLDRNSTNNILYANSSFRNEQDGVTVFESSCNVVANNQLAGNKRDGLKIRNSIDIGAYGNTIEANAKSGVSASIASNAPTKGEDALSGNIASHAPVTGLSLRNNSFSSNGVGINVQGASGVAMFSNTFVNQSKRLLGGDLRGLEGPVLRLAGQADVLVASTCRPARPVLSCRLLDAGHIKGEIDRHIFNPQTASDCTDVSGSVQHRAFSNSSQGS